MPKEEDGSSRGAFYEKRSQEDEGKGSVPVIDRQPERTERSRIKKMLMFFVRFFVVAAANLMCQLNVTCKMYSTSSSNDVFLYE